MKEYFLLFRGGTYPEKGSDEAKAHMAKWGAWMSDLKESDKLKSGLPFNDDGKIVSADGTVSEGTVEPNIGGYLHISAGSLDEAAEIAKGCPGLEVGCQVEVRECMSM